MSYTALKNLHILLAAVTLTGFILRGYWALSSSPLRQQRWVRVVPHVIDTVFLLAGVAMVLQLAINPIMTPWLLAKIGGLLGYIVLGSIALRRGRTRRQRLLALLGAVSCFVYIVGVAVHKTPASWWTLA
ncbi:MAG: SirB2 family protein [Pseudomonadota bacterium]